MKSNDQSLRLLRQTTVTMHLLLHNKCVPDWLPIVMLDFVFIIIDRQSTTTFTRFYYNKHAVSGHDVLILASETPNFSLLYFLTKAFNFILRGKVKGEKCRHRSEGGGFVAQLTNRRIMTFPISCEPDKFREI